MNACRACLTALLGLLAPALAHAAEAPVWHADFVHETAVQLDDGDVGKFRNRFEPDLAWDLDAALRLTAAARLLWDPAFEGFEREAALREMILDWRGETVSIKAGLQQAVWGEASGFLSSFDVFHPRDLREFVLPPFDFLRRPLWMLRIQRELGDWNADVLWSPQRLVDRTPDPGEPFYAPTPPPAGASTVDGGREIDSGRFGLRLARTVGALDLAAIYMRVPRSDAIFRRAPTGAGALAETELHRSFDVAGVSFARAFARSVLRGEASLYHNRDYQLRESPGVARADQINLVTGLDMTFLADLEVTVEAGYRRVLEHTLAFAEPERRTTWLLQLRKPLVRDTVKLSFATIANRRDGDSLLRLGIDWAADDRTTLSAGLDLFTGPPDSPFGRFRDRDRIYVGLAYRF